MERRMQNIPVTVKTGSGGVSTVYTFIDHALVVSENHPFINGRFTAGGPFFVRKREIWFEPYEVNWRLNGVSWSGTTWMGYHSNSPLVPWTTSQLVDAKSQAFADANAFGATGWKRARPGNPVAGVAQLVGETKDFLPSLPKKLYGALNTLLQRKQQAKQNGAGKLGDAYLNVQFGWLPLLSDIRKMYELSQTIDKRLAEIVRQNGKGIHRRRLIRDSTQTTIINEWRHATQPFMWWQGYAPPQWVGGTSRMDETLTVTDKIWFVGKFRYYIPDIGSSEWTKRTTRALYGANITPEVAWNLLPWSWLIDWFGNIGDVMSNMSSNAVDNLTADYAYIMRTQETRYDMEGATTWNQLGSPTGASWIPAGRVQKRGWSTTTTKTRVGASPFGFGLTFDGLSTYQLGIAAALGISRWA